MKKIIISIIVLSVFFQQSHSSNFKCNKFGNSTVSFNQKEKTIQISDYNTYFICN